MNALNKKEVTMVLSDIQAVDPWTLILKIVTANQTDEIDARAQITIHGANGMTWQGVPTKIVEFKETQFVILSSLGAKKVFYVAATQLAALEIENPSSLVSYFTKPWLSNPQFASMSKLQATREIDTLGKSINNILFNVHFDTFPLKDETPGALTAWSILLKTELDRLNQDPTGNEALKQLQAIEIKFNSQGMSAQKTNSTLTVQLNLEPDNFNKKQIEQLLNSNL